MKIFTLIVLTALVSCGETPKDKDVVLETTAPDKDTTEKVTPQNELVIVPGGKHLEYWPSGQLKIQGQYDMQSLRTGLWMSYYESGIKWSESYYIDGLRHGHSLTFFTNGQVRYVGEFLKDEKSGLWTFYDEEGNKIKEERFDEN